MHKFVITVLTVIITLFLGIAAQAQTAKPAEQKTTEPAAKDQPTTPAANQDTKEPDDVEQMMAEAKKRGEIVLAICIYPCPDDNKVTGDVEKGHALALPKPNYPPLARAAHVAGTVEVRVLIDFDGKVIAAVAASGHPLLYGVSVAAARAAEFTPMKLNGQPVKVTGVIQYNFVAQ